MRFRIFATCAACLVLSHGALAGPDATANRFLSDTVSMLEWGMDRLERSLAKESLGMPVVTYNWDRNRIEIQRDMRLFDEPLPANAEQLCRDWMRDIRYEAGVFTDGRLALRDMKSSLFIRFFAHNGFYRKFGELDEVSALVALDKLIHLQMTYWGIREGEPALLFRCSGDLVSASVAIERH